MDLDRIKARAAEIEAKKSGDLARQKEAAAEFARRDAELKKQAEVAKTAEREKLAAEARAKGDGGGESASIRGFIGLVLIMRAASTAAQVSNLAAAMPPLDLVGHSPSASR